MKEHTRSESTDAKFKTGKTNSECSVSGWYIFVFSQTFFITIGLATLARLKIVRYNPTWWLSSWKLRKLFVPWLHYLLAV